MGVVSVVENSFGPPTCWPVRQKTIEPRHDQKVAGSNRFKGQLNQVRLGAVPSRRTPWRAGEGLVAIARSYAVSHSTISRIAPASAKTMNASIEDEVSLAALTVSDQT
jgi:hypothetical protein